MIPPSVIVIYTIASVFTCIAILLTGLLIYRHLNAACDPVLSRHILYILLMIPFSVTNTFMSVLFPEHCLYFDILKDGYEAFVLYRFYLLLIYYFNCDAPTYFQFKGTYNHSELHPKLITKEMITQNIEAYFTYCEPYHAPFNLFIITSSTELYLWINRLIIQYLTLRFVLPLFIIPFHLLGIYNHGDMAFNNTYLWLSLMTNMSISLTIGSLYIFICIIKPVIKAREPKFKFLSIKILILFIFWQSNFFSILSYLHVITPVLFSGYWSPSFLLTEVLHNTMACFELLCLSVYHIWIFPVPDKTKELIGA